MRSKFRGKLFLRTFLLPGAPFCEFRPARRANFLPILAPERHYFAGKPPFARLRPKNKADILHLANHHDLGKVHFLEEKVSGKVPWRKRKIGEVLESLQAHDTIIVSELSRLGRSMLECMEILAIATQKGISIYAVKGNWRLDHSIQSKIIAMAFSMAAEIEHDLISQRTKEALRFKKL